METATGTQTETANRGPNAKRSGPGSSHRTEAAGSGVDASWNELLPRLERLRPLLREQGSVVTKRIHDRVRYYLRYCEVVNQQKVQRSLYLGSDIELAERTRRLLDEFRWHARELRQLSLFLRWTRACAGMAVQSTTGRPI